MNEGTAIPLDRDPRDIAALELVRQCEALERERDAVVAELEAARQEIEKLRALVPVEDPPTAELLSLIDEAVKQCEAGRQRASMPFDVWANIVVAARAVRVGQDGGQ